MAISNLHIEEKLTSFESNTRGYIYDSSGNIYTCINKVSDADKTYLQKYNSTGVFQSEALISNSTNTKMQILIDANDEILFIFIDSTDSNKLKFDRRDISLASLNTGTITPNAVGQFCADVGGASRIWHVTYEETSITDTFYVSYTSADAVRNAGPHTVTTTNIDQVLRLRRLSTDGVVIAYMNSTTGFIMYTVFDSSGGLVIGNTSTTFENQDCIGLCVDSSDNFYINTERNTSAVNDFAYRKYNSSGVLQGSTVPYQLGRKDEAFGQIVQFSNMSAIISGDYMVVSSEYSGVGNYMSILNVNTAQQIGNTITISTGTGIGDNTRNYFIDSENFYYQINLTSIWKFNLNKTLGTVQKAGSLIFGTGRDGDLTISADTDIITLYETTLGYGANTYNENEGMVPQFMNLTIDATRSLKPKIGNTNDPCGTITLYVRGKLTINGTIGLKAVNGGSGGNNPYGYSSNDWSWDWAGGRQVGVNVNSTGHEGIQPIQDDRISIANFGEGGVAALSASGTNGGNGKGGGGGYKIKIFANEIEMGSSGAITSEGGDGADVVSASSQVYAGGAGSGGCIWIVTNGAELGVGQVDARQGKAGKDTSANSRNGEWGFAGKVRIDGRYVGIATVPIYEGSIPKFPYGNIVGF